MKKVLSIALAIIFCLCAKAQTIDKELNKENGFTYVDLGLPSGTLWAARNVGASSITRYGNYFAWGETKAKGDYSWETYKFTTDKTAKGISKYQWADKSTGSYWYRSGVFVGDNVIRLNSEDDVAHVIMGGRWHTPTSAQFYELIENTTQIWVKNFKDSNTSGCIFQSKINKKAIFFPAAGNKNGMEFVDDGSMGFYWTSDMIGKKVTTVSMAETSEACLICIYDGGNYFEYEPRCNGLSVRAVCELK